MSRQSEPGRSREVARIGIAAGATRALSSASLSAFERVRALTRRSGGQGIDIVIVPQDLRTADPSLASELALGTFGLAGAFVDLGGGSPWRVKPPTPQWHDALHGFAWLGDLRAAATPQALMTARTLVSEWLLLHQNGLGEAWRPELAARRAMSWLMNAGLLLQDSDSNDYDMLISSLLTHLKLLAQVQDGALAPEPRLLCRIAAVFGALCVSEQDKLLAAELPRLLDELDRQVLADGGLITRHPGTGVDILLELLPLRTCFAARDVSVPPRFQAVIERLLPMLRHVRLGDGSIVRFNGMPGTQPDRIAAVLAYDERRAFELEAAPQTRYVRLQRRQSIVVIDAGPPPPLESSSESHAGCLAFEMSAGRYPLIVNCGAPGPADQDWRLQARATASHSTLVLGDQSSGRLVREGAVYDRLGVPLLADPVRVESAAGAAEDGAAEFRGSHDGYVSRTNIVHSRVLRLTPQGDRLDGADRLHRLERGGTEKRMTYAIHFHAHPSARVTRARDADGGEITLPNGECWRLTAQTADLNLEESIYLAHLSGPMRSIQLVLRGTALGETEIRWRLERVKASDHRSRRGEPRT